VVKGDNAVVPVTITVQKGRTTVGGEAEKVNMRREGGEWRVYGVVWPGEDRYGTPIDFELE